ncbi:MAG: hypothetical protein ACREA2_17115 [Blastocatellia bacterium]
MVKQTNDQTIIRYLLNELSEEDQALFEEAYLSDGSLFEQVQALEEELIEDYVKGDLSGHERLRFERHYLASDQRRARIQSARELFQVCSPKSSPRTGADDRIESKFFSPRPLLRLFAKRRLAPVFGVAAALLLLLGAGLFIEMLRLRRHLATVNEERTAIERRAEESERRLAREREQLDEERKQSVALQEKLEQEIARSQTTKNQIVFLSLTPGIRDINRPDRAVISARTSFVEMRVDLERQGATTPRSYKAVVKTVDGGREIWTQEGIKTRRRNSAQYIVVRVPADRFKAAGAQDFTLTLGALTGGEKDYEELDSYYFQVAARLRQTTK